MLEGDSSDLRLGLSDADYETLKSCTVIFHLAASVRFDDPLKKAILLNTRGSREVCELAKELPSLKVFVHVSTAYVQPLVLNVEEEMFAIDCDWRKYVQFAEELPEDLLDSLTLKSVLLFVWISLGYSTFHY